MESKRQELLNEAKRIASIECKNSRRSALEKVLKEDRVVFRYYYDSFIKQKMDKARKAATHPWRR